MQQDTFNDTRNNCVTNSCVNQTQTNRSDNMANTCNNGNEEEVMHRHHQRKEHMPIGMAYVPMQEWSEMYDACEGLYEGCAFPELNLIFCGVRGN
jgi:formylmethanofuran dehydrogenase subunit D